MEHDFWLSRWQEGRIGFHEGAPNTTLEKNLAHLGRGKRVLVPLCGKTEDMAFLAGRGHQVVGVELARLAAEAFFREHGLTPQVRRLGPFEAFEGGAVTLLVGDIFDASRTWVGEVNALYDRAALVALPEPMRSAYAKHLGSLLPKGAPGLLVTFQYPEDAMKGPPFSIRESTVRALFPGMAVEKVSELPATNPRLAELGTPSQECGYALTF
jgi:thiopurine S-methyltransferase